MTWEMVYVAPTAIVCLVIFVIVCICACCKRKQRGRILGYGGAPVTITSQHIQATPVVPLPYPVGSHSRPPGQPPYPTGLPIHPSPGSYQHSDARPPAAGYAPVGIAPPGPIGITPYPPTSGEAVAPYPPPPEAVPHMAQPPSYFEAVGHPPAQPPLTTDGYSKQAPFNPNY